MRALPLALLALAPLAGCGGHGKSYADRADAICLRQQRAIAALPSSTDPNAFAALFERRLRLAREEIRELRALDPPRGRERAVAGLLRELGNEIAAAGRLRVASLIGDVESAQGALFQGRQATRRAHRYAGALGLGVCGGGPPVQ